MKNKIVTHPGTIKKIELYKVEVAIMVTSGCASCEVKGACTVSEVEEKVVMVSMQKTSQYKVGQLITIEMSQSLGTWAVLLGYVFPFMVLLLGLILFINIGLDQGLAGVFSLALLVPYYAVLYLLRNYLSTRFTYNIRS
ncbi:MAG: SoxR reducing system RseC family protein [Bacteroidota bacterium]